MFDAPVADDDGIPTLVRYSRKTKEQYVQSEVEGKATGWKAFYENGKWVVSNTAKAKKTKRKAPAKTKAKTKPKAKAKSKAKAKPKAKKTNDHFISISVCEIKFTFVKHIG